LLSLVVVQFEPYPSLWRQVCVKLAKKRTKADRLQRQTEQLEKRANRRPDEIEKKTTREGVNQAAAQTVRQVTEGR
jgi:hypothetical protein